MEDRDKPNPPVEVEIEERFKELIEQLAAQAPAEDITDADIDREVQAVRKAAWRAWGGKSSAFRLEPVGRGDS